MRPLLSTPLVLSAQEQAELPTVCRQRTAPQRAVQRARLLLLAAQNLPLPTIASTVQGCANTVRKWIQRYRRPPPATAAAAHAGPTPAGSEPPPSKVLQLADASRSGRPDTFTGQQGCALIALACEKPQDHGRPITHWSARELKDQAIQEGLVNQISERHLQRLLATVDLQPHRSRYWLNAKPDPQKDEKIRAVCALYHQAQEAAARGMLTFSVEERTGLQALARIAPDRPLEPGKPVRREFESERHGTLSLLAGLAVASGQVQALCRSTRNETDFLDFTAGLVRAHPEAREFIFIADNLNTHQSESLVRYVARTEGRPESAPGLKGKEGILQTQESRARLLQDPTHRLRFCYTPKHASWMNQIEIWFGILVRQVVRRGHFTSVADLQQQLEAFIQYFNRTIAKAFQSAIDL